VIVVGMSLAACAGLQEIWGSLPCVTSCRADRAPIVNSSAGLWVWCMKITDQDRTKHMRVLEYAELLNGRRIK